MVSRQSLPVVMEPVGDALHLQPQLWGEVLDSGGTGVGVQEEGDVESLPLVFGDGGAGLLVSGAASLRGRVAVIVHHVQGGAAVRAAVQAVSPLARLPVLTLGAQQLLDVVWVIQPELHPVEGSGMRGPWEFVFSYLMKGSLPLMLSMCQAFGLLSSSDTEPCDSPRTHSPNSWNTRAVRRDSNIVCRQSEWKYDLLDVFIVRNGSIELDQIV